MLTPGENESSPVYVSQPPTYRPEGEPNHEGENTVLAGKLRELEIARPHMVNQEYEKAKKDIINNFVGGVSVDVLDPPIGHPTQNQSDKQKIVQFRVADASGGDHLDDNTYWLEKDGYSYSRVPESLARDGLQIVEWQDFHDDIRKATHSFRYRYAVCCMLGGLCCSPLSCIYLCGRDWCLKREFHQICRRHEEIWVSYGIKIILTSFMSIIDMDPTPYAHILTASGREEERGVYVFQLILRNLIR